VQIKIKSVMDLQLM